MQLSTKLLPSSYPAAYTDPRSSALIDLYGLPFKSSYRAGDPSSSRKSTEQCASLVDQYSQEEVLEACSHRGIEAAAKRDAQRPDTAATLMALLDETEPALWK